MHYTLHIVHGSFFAHFKPNLAQTGSIGVSQLQGGAPNRCGTANDTSPVGVQCVITHALDDTYLWRAHLE